MNLSRLWLRKTLFEVKISFSLYNLERFEKGIPNICNVGNIDKLH